MPDEHAYLKLLLEENLALAKENNVLLKKLHRESIIGMIFRVIWFALFIGLPFALYFYILEPYLSVLQSGLQQIPGFEGFSQFLGKGM